MKREKELLERDSNPTFDLPNDHPLRKLISRFRKRSERSLVVMSRNGSDVEMGERKGSMDGQRRFSNNRMSVLAEMDSESSSVNSKMKFGKGLLDGLVAFSKSGGFGSRRSSYASNNVDLKQSGSPREEKKDKIKDGASSDHSESSSSQIGTKQQSLKNVASGSGLAKTSKWGKILGNNLTSTSQQSKNAKSPLKTKIHPESQGEASTSKNVYTNDGFRFGTGIDERSPQDNIKKTLVVPELRLESETGDLILTDEQCRSQSMVFDIT